MRNYRCTCGNRLFFDNSRCLNCGAETGHCPQCKTVISLILQPNGLWQCGNPDCRTLLRKCSNYEHFNICNRCVVPSELAREGAAAKLQLCDCCRFNHVIPNLDVEGNLQKWARLEAAKRRLLYELNLLRLPYGSEGEGVEPPLAFDFMGDILPEDNHPHQLDQTERVYTGHHAGTVTINIIEADDVEREKARVSLGEPQRTLLGHFRHEIGHYYWDLLVKGCRESECIAVFGNHRAPEYEVALEAYYQNGPKPNWPDRFISAYASMHPWEDFAETWATYLTLFSEYDTALHVGFLSPKAEHQTNLKAMIADCQLLSVSLNEMNRSLGVMDAMPKPIVAPVVEKLQFIHNLIQHSHVQLQKAKTAAKVSKSTSG